MAADNEVSLLFKIKADSAQMKSATAEAKAAISVLRGAFGTELGAMQNIGKTAFSALSEHVNLFARQRIPIAGGAVVNLTSNLEKLALGGGKTSKEVEKVGKAIASISSTSGKSTAEVAGFLTKFTQIEKQADRDSSAITFFGAQMGAKLIPQLEATAEGMGAVAGEAEGLGAVLAGTAATGVGIFVIALLAVAAAEIFVAKQIFDLTKAAAEFEGQMFDVAQQTGVTVETLSTLEVVAATTGGSLGSMAASLGIFQRKLEEATDPLSKVAEKFRELGVDTENTETALRQTLKSLNDMPVGAAQTAAALELFGRGGKALLAVLKETDGDLDKTTEKLRKMGILISTETAEAADEFNDQLTIIHFQLRALSGELASVAMPIVLRALREFSALLENNKAAVSAIAIVIGSFAELLFGKLAEGLQTINFLVTTAKTAWDSLKGTLDAVAAAYRAVRDAAEAAAPFIPGTNIPTSILSGGSSTPTTPKPDETKPDTSIQKALKQQIVEQQEITTAIRSDAEERRRIANQRIADAELAFLKGTTTRRNELKETLAANKEKLTADLSELALEKAKAATLLALHKDDAAKAREDRAKITQIDNDAKAKIAENDQNDAKREAELKAQELSDDVAHRQRLLDIASEADRASIDLIKARVAAGTKSASKGEDEIEEIENAGLNRRYVFLLKSLSIAGLEPAKRREINDALKALGQERTNTEQAQRLRREEIIRAGVERERDIILGGLETTIRIGELRDATVIASLRSLAALRIKTEEETERAILKVRLDAIDREKAAAEARLTATGLTTDADARAKEQAKINNDIRILNAEREALEKEGETNVEEGRQRDLENLRDYRDKVEEIEGEISDEKVRLADLEVENLRNNFGKRLQILEAQRAADLLALEVEAKRVADHIKAQESTNESSIRLLRKLIEDQKRLANIQSGEEKKNTEESIDNLEKELERKLELEKLFAERRLLTEEEFQRRKKEIEDRFNREKEKIDEFGISIRSIAQSIEDSIVPLGDILTGAFSQITDAIGQTVKTWVLLGETGPAIMRKILAEALASIAAEAAMNAIKQLALGFAALFWNPGEAAAHFTSAALWGALAGGAALAGRAVAGDAFKSKPAAAAGGGGGTKGGGGSGSGSGDDGKQIINMSRNQIVEHIVIIRAEPGFVAKEIVRAVDNNNPQLNSALKKASGG